jgi:hypothetical protein
LVATKTLWLALVSLPCQGSLVNAPNRQPAHLGGSTLASVFWNLAAEDKLFELWKGNVTEAVMLSHELGLFVGGRELDVLGFFGQR